MISSSHSSSLFYSLTSAIWIWCCCCWANGSEESSQERKNEKWKLIYIWTMLNMNDWLQSFFLALHFSLYSVRNFFCSPSREDAEFFHISEWCRRGPINVKKPQTKWQFQNANCTFCLLATFFFIIVHWHSLCVLSCLLSCVTCNCLLALWRPREWRWWCREREKMDTFANLMFVENIKQLTASI
jgi:hypothetical protein